MTKNTLKRNIDGAGEVAILVSKDLNIKEISNTKVRSEDMEVLRIEISNLSKKLKIISVYRRPGRVEAKGTWTKLLSQIKKIENVMCLGDFNAHNRSWNCHNTDRNGNQDSGRIWRKEMEEKGMHVVNFDILSRIGEGGVRPANLDLMFASEDI